jgi:hypothetical protein
MVSCVPRVSFHSQPQPLDGCPSAVTDSARPLPRPAVSAPCLPQANVGRKRRGEAPSNVLCLLSESIRRNTHIRPTLASGEHGAPVQGLGLRVGGDFPYTTYRPGSGALWWKSLISLSLRARRTYLFPSVRSAGRASLPAGIFPGRRFLQRQLLLSRAEAPGSCAA